ncbi:hypothetical protein FNF28_04372 [Cafeteria roenbergensis]|uniref:Uncharacterized protein n=1 Tax=Cafeteria roenbergensis TaxID=33653 RepID=A0A5A8DCA3_CAFRO|nr:hypothetical protein FNF28_04372 [Cafeteria roenbergensis]
MAASSFAAAVQAADAVVREGLGAGSSALGAALSGGTGKGAHSDAVWQLATENAIRDLARAAMVQASASGEPSEHVRTIAALVDGSAAAANAGTCSPALPMQVLEIAFASTPVSHCAALWDVAESRASTLGSPPFVPLDAGSNPASKVALLRLSNGLLARLSSVHDAELCGRVLLFLGHVLRLSDKSGLNAAGHFAESPASRPARPSASGDTEDDEEAATWDRFERFWSLQDLCARPWEAVESSDSWLRAVAAFDGVLSTVRESVSQCSRTARSQVAASAGASGSTAPPAGADGVSIEALPEGGADAIVNHLTAPSLLHLQLRDPAFLRHVLLQAVIALRYVRDLPPSRQPGPGVASRVEEDVPQLQAEAWRLFEQAGALSGESGAASASLASTARRLVASDDHWTAWKREGCRSFEEPSPAVEDGPDGIAARAAKARAAQADALVRDFAAAKAAGAGPAASRGLDWLEGGGGADPWARGHLSEPATAARDATELTARSVLEACAQRGASLVPCLSSLVAEVKEALDPESFMFDAESAPYRDQQWAWRAMRLMRVQDAKAFESITRESAIPQVMAGLAGVPVPEGDVNPTRCSGELEMLGRPVG